MLHYTHSKSTKHCNSFVAQCKVWLEATNLCLNYPSRKLAPKQQGPFEISQVPSPLIYCLCLPATWKIHNTFHTSLLSSYKETETHGPNFSKSLPDLIGAEEEYEVKQIISHCGTSGLGKYLTAWKGYPLSENIWEPKSNLQHAAEILGIYKQTHQLNYLTTMPCPSSQHMTSTSSSTFDSITSTLTTLRPTPASVGNLHAPSTTRITGRGISL